MCNVRKYQNRITSGKHYGKQREKKSKIESRTERRRKYRQKQQRVCNHKGCCGHDRYRMQPQLSGKPNKVWRYPREWHTQLLTATKHNYRSMKTHYVHKGIFVGAI